MERGNTKHGPHADEQLAHEVDGLVRGGHDPRAEEWKTGEPSGEDQPDVDLAPDTTLAGGVPAGMSEADVEMRTELARWLTRGAFPADRASLVERLRAANAPDTVVELAGSVPDAEYGSVGELWRALSGGVEARRF